MRLPARGIDQALLFVLQNRRDQRLRSRSNVPNPIKIQRAAIDRLFLSYQGRAAELHNFR